jgi:hypothetical protein
MPDLVSAIAAVVLLASGPVGGPLGGADSVAAIPVGSAAVGSIAVGSTPAPPRPVAAAAVPARHVTEHLCERFHYRPVRMLIACGDGNAQVVRLRWTEWTSAAAVGVGIWRQNDCRPDCADGKFHDYPVRLAFSRPMHAGPHRFFGRVTADFPHSAPAAPAYRSGHAVLMDAGRQHRPSSRHTR